MKQNEHEKVKSLRLYHLGLTIMSLLGILAVIFINDWDKIIVWLPIAVAIFFDGKFEKNDELSKVNIRKANSIAMWFLLAAMLYFAMFSRFHTISTSMIIIAIFLALAIRSGAFLIFDMIFIGEQDG